MIKRQAQDVDENPLWSETAIADPIDESLVGDQHVDVLVVGGGYSGLSSALHLAEKGVSVIVIESKTIGFGGSGRNVGLVNAGVWKSPEYVKQQLGVDAAAKFNAALRDSPQFVFDLIRRYSMSCKASQCGTVNMAHSSASMRDLQLRFNQMEKNGSKLKWLDGEQSQLLSAAKLYRHGGILDSTAGTIQPLSYTRSLAKVAIRLGAKVYQHSALRSLAKVRGRWLAKTAQGSVSAAQVIIASNAYSDENCQEVDKSSFPVYIFQCATAPLPEQLAESIIPKRQGLWDTQLLMTSSRIDSAGRLIMCAPGNLAGFHKSVRMNWLLRMRAKIFPQLGSIPWKYHWSGQIGVTSNKLFKVQLLAPGVFAPAGYNGRGIGLGTLMGKHLAETIVSGNRDVFPFPIEALYRQSWRKSRRYYVQYASLGLQAMCCWR